MIKCLCKSFSLLLIALFTIKILIFHSFNLLMLEKLINTLKKIMNHNKIICYFVQSVYTHFDLLILEKFIYTVNNLTARKPREREKCPSQWCN